MDKITTLIKNCLVQAEYQDEQWRNENTGELMSEKITKLMLDFANYIGDNALAKVDIFKKGEYQYQKWGDRHYLDNTEDNTLFNQELLKEFLSQYKLDLFKP